MNTVGSLYVVWCYLRRVQQKLGQWAFLDFLQLSSMSPFRLYLYNASSTVFQALVSFERVSTFLELEEIEVGNPERDLCMSGEC